MVKKVSRQVPGAFWKYSIKDLVLIVLWNSKSGWSFERLLKECFSSFPQRFCLEEYKKWPDARKIDRLLRLLRREGFIILTDQKFQLSDKGKKRSLLLNKMLKQKRLI